MKSGNRHRLNESWQAVSPSETSQVERYYHHYHLESPMCIDLLQIPCELDGSVVLLDKAEADKNGDSSLQSRCDASRQGVTSTILPPTFRGILRRIPTKVVVVVKTRHLFFTFEKKNEL